MTLFKDMILKLKSINKISKFVMIFGSALSSILLIFDLIFYLIYINSKFIDYATNEILITTVKTATAIFTEAMIGAIFIDYYANNTKQK